MNRNDIYGFINLERDSQDALWRTGRHSEYQYRFIAPHILLLEEQLAKLRSLWYSSKKEELQDRLVKIAATTVRALEEIA